MYFDLKERITALESSLDTIRVKFGERLRTLVEDNKRFRQVMDEHQNPKEVGGKAELSL